MSVNNSLERGSGVVKIAVKGLFAISRLKIRTWTKMPLKVGIIATFKRLLIDCSLFTGSFLLVSAGSLINKRWKWSRRDRLESALESNLAAKEKKFPLFSRRSF